MVLSFIIKKTIKAYGGLNVLKCVGVEDVQQITDESTETAGNVSQIGPFVLLFFCSFVRKKLKLTEAENILKCVGLC